MERITPLAPDAHGARATQRKGERMNKQSRGRIKNMKTKITIEPKKNVSIETIWNIEQDRPYPDMGARWSTPRWRNTGGLFAEFGNPAYGLKKDFRAELLRNDTEEHDITSRLSSAGYNGNPGSFDYRGKYLGEISVDITPRLVQMGKGFCARWRVRGFETPTNSEVEFLNAAVLPGLLAAIEANRAELKAYAVKCIKEKAAQCLADARKALDAMGEQMERAISQL